ncbi:MAG: DUF368 domain-containing protein [Clostridiales bacterium]
MKYLMTIIHGMLIGIANIIPGLSGGTIAYMIGIYERFIGILSNPKIILKEKKERNFIVTLGLGAVIGIIIFSKVFMFILEHVSLKQHFYLFIVGTILGTIVYTMRTEKGYSISNFGIILFVIIVFALIDNIKPPFNSEVPEGVTDFLGFIKIAKVDPIYSVWLFICGLLAASSMLLPGFSGSALLVSLGEYENIIGFIDVKALMIIQIAFVGCGAVVGIVFFSKLISKLMKKYKIQTIYVIIGLMITSIYKLFTEIWSDFIFSQIIISIIACIIGYFMAFLLSSKK